MAGKGQDAHILMRIENMERTVSGCKEKICQFTANHAYMTSKLTGLEEDFNLKLQNLETRLVSISGTSCSAGNPSDQSQANPSSCEKRLVEKIDRSHVQIHKRVDDFKKSVVDMHTQLRKDTEERIQRMENEVVEMKGESPRKGPVKSDIPKGPKMPKGGAPPRQRPNAMKNRGDDKTQRRDPSADSNASSGPIGGKMRRGQFLSWELFGVRDFYTKASAGNPDYLKGISEKIFIDKFGYQFQFEIFLNGSPNFYTWNNFISLGLKACSSQVNQKKGWPIKRNYELGLVKKRGGRGVAFKKLRADLFKNPGNVTWTYDFCKLDDAFGLRRDFNTDFIGDDSIEFSLIFMEL